MNRPRNRRPLLGLDTKAQPNRALSIASTDMSGGASTDISCDGRQTFQRVVGSLGRMRQLPAREATKETRSQQRPETRHDSPPPSLACLVGSPLLEGRNGCATCRAGAEQLSLDRSEQCKTVILASACFPIISCSSLLDDNTGTCKPPFVGEKKGLNYSHGSALTSTRQA